MRLLIYLLAMMSGFSVAASAPVVRETAKARASLAPAVGAAKPVAVSPDTPIDRHDIILG